VENFFRATLFFSFDTKNKPQIMISIHGSICGFKPDVGCDSSSLSCVFLSYFGIFKTPAYLAAFCKNVSLAKDTTWEGSFFLGMAV